MIPKTLELNETDNETIKFGEICYSLEFIEYAVARATIVDELVADLADNVIDDIDVYLTGCRAPHHSKIPVVNWIIDANRPNEKL